MFVIAIVSLCALFGQLNASAIPMWEYLTRQEKISFLYSMFASQVENYCDSSTMMDNCNTELLKYGLDRLKTMPDDVLDGMDPYQRAANDIIWATLLKGHPNARTVPKAARSTTTAKPNSYEDQSFDFGSPQGAASARIDNIYFVLPPKGFKPFSSMDKSNQRHPYAQNIVGLLSEKQGVYTRYQQQHTTTPHPYDSFEEEDEEVVDEQQPLSGGPMVVRVYPDGTPVDEGGNDGQMPQDEDLQQYKLSQMRIPNF